MMTYSSAVSSVGTPLSLSKLERQPDQESVTATTADIVNMNLSGDGQQRRLTTLTIDNAPALNNRGIDKDKAVTTATVTSSLLQKTVTLASANLGSCDKNPGKADTILDTGAIVGNEGDTHTGKRTLRVTQVRAALSHVYATTYQNIITDIL
jgi:hypothetical protein